jgi:hypothetical protein
MIFSQLLDGNKLIDLFNKQSSTIQLEGSTVDKHGIFLDIDITITGSDMIITKVYQKPSNKYLYIPPFSAHSNKNLHNIIVQEIKRYRLYSTLDKDFKSIINSFRQRLYAGGYQPQDIDRFFKEESLPSRDYLISKLLQSTNNNNNNNNNNSNNNHNQENNKNRKPVIVVQLQTWNPHLT